LLLAFQAGLLSAVGRYRATAAQRSYVARKETTAPPNKGG
jgi:hypothetical protein